LKCRCIIKRVNGHARISIVPRFLWFSELFTELFWRCGFIWAYLLSIFTLYTATINFIVVIYWIYTLSLVSVSDFSVQKLEPSTKVIRKKRAYCKIIHISVWESKNLNLFSIKHINNVKALFRIYILNRNQEIFESVLAYKGDV
jgi:hypothetical protein